MRNEETLIALDNDAIVTAGNATEDYIKSRIFTVRGVQVMLDRDLAVLYGVETGALNRQVKRNNERFPEDFMFRLSSDEWSNLKCKIGISRWGGDRRLPYAFTENGVAMLSGVLRSPTAIEINIRIMRVFNAMRRVLSSIAPILARLAETERRQLEDRTRQITDQQRNEERFDTIFKAMDGGDFPPQKVFFDGKHHEAFSFARKLVRKAAKSIVKQTPTLTVKACSAFHDRFLVLDGTELYHLGASLRDLGRKYCAVTKMDAMFIPSILQRI